MNYYGDIDPYVCRWLENLILSDLIPDGDVDGRSIVDVTAGDLKGYRQVHLFCGIAGWPLALQLAGWPADREVWTGSCPCQPFSSAGEGKGFDDERHLWPHFFRLIRECRPAAVFGEQVASKAADPWVDLVFADLESVDYACGAVAFPSAGVGAPHIRDRTYWMGYARGARGAVGLPEQAQRQEGVITSIAYDGSGGRAGAGRRPSGARLGGMAYGAGDGLDEAGQRLAQARCDGAAGDGGARGVGDPGREPRQRGAGGLSRTEAPKHGTREGVDGRELDGLEHAGEGQGERPCATHGFWRDADWLACRDGKWRPVEPGTFPLANGLSGRLGRLRAYGNAINPHQASEFLKAAMECMP